MDSSLNLNGLANSLPSSNLANVEKELSGNFKDAALALATFYRSSRRTTKRAYNAGYMNACQDLLLMIQQGVSTGESSDAAAGRGMTIGRIMDYIEARLEAIKSRQEEEEEEEERERERERDKTSKGSPGQGVKVANTPIAVAAPTKAPTRSKDHGITPPTPRTPSMHALSSYSSFPPSSPSSPPSSSCLPQSPSETTHVPSSLTRAAAAAAKSRTLSKDSIVSPFAFDPAMSPLPLSLPMTTHEPPSVAVVSPTPLPLSLIPDSVVSLGAGNKRRHAAMLTSSESGGMGDVPAGVTSNAGTSRRRTTRGGRGTFGAGHLRELQNHQSQGTTSDTMMDVEEEGRERKRTARR